MHKSWHSDNTGKPFLSSESLLYHCNIFKYEATLLSEECSCCEQLSNRVALKLIKLLYMAFDWQF